MNGKLYWKQRIPFLLLQLLCMIGLFLFLFLIGNNPDSILLILLVWALILAATMLLSYFNRKKQLEELLFMTVQLEERYLISEVMEQPKRAEDLVFYQILKYADKSMLEQINTIRRERMEYKEYIEQWIHEVKTPITAIRLLCENNRLAFTKELLMELEEIWRYTEQALYYARSEHTEKDYSVREIRLFDVVHQAIADNKQILLGNQVKIELEENDCMVYTDDKWIRFILNQLIVNAVKYRSETPSLRFAAERDGEQVRLLAEDNGIGIAKEDLPRIFEKGYTGTNGRKESHSTGMGLYLCKRLCDKLGIEIAAKSGEKGTTIELTFYINDFIYKVQGR